MKRWLYDNSQLTGTVPSPLFSLFLLDIYVDCIDVACSPADVVTVAKLLPVVLPAHKILEIPLPC